MKTKLKALKISMSISIGLYLVCCFVKFEFFNPIEAIRNMTQGQRGLIAFLYIATQGIIYANVVVDNKVKELEEKEYGV